VVRVRRGEELDIHFENRLPEETTVHWHGMLAPADMDGHPSDAVPPGGSYRYRYPVVQDGATNWYHPHPHGRTGAQAALGLAGLLIVEDEREANSGLPTGDADLGLVLRDARLDPAGHLHYQRADWGYRGDFPLVNGIAYPRMEVNAGVYRLRLANASNSRVFRLQLDPRVPMVLIGTDGGLLDSPMELSEVTLGPAERLDLLADFRGIPRGHRIPLRCRSAGWDLLHFEVRGAGAPSAPLPTTLPGAARHLPLGPPVREREFVFQGHHRINGRRYEMGRVEFTVPRGDTELWRFRSDGGAPHPVHVHGTHFRVVGRRGGRNRVFPWERGWKDTVLLERGETVEVLLRFDHYPGIYMLHCHKLEHEDGGMMMDFRVD
jgi:FtsP/CotA-like multicopper oxidase with cupredoxin domain